MSVKNLPQTAEVIGGLDGTLILRVVDQRALPQELVFVELRTAKEVIQALKNMTVRGAPVIGFCGAAALMLWAHNESQDPDVITFLKNLKKVANDVSHARPTAINLAREVQNLVEVIEAHSHSELASLKQTIKHHVVALAQEDERINRAIGKHGAELLRPGSRVLTHCNAGSLATVFYGTALGVIYSAFEQKKIEQVYIDETRPMGQGARLTTWELSRVGIPGALLCDNMAASLMAQGKIDAIIVGADRIAANGDTANKIGTYGLAVIARYHDISFYVAAPLSTFDPDTVCGQDIPIEQRASSEVTSHAQKGITVYNPAFDVTPANLITRFITEKGVFTPSDLDVLQKST